MSCLPSVCPFVRTIQIGEYSSATAVAIRVLNRKPTRSPP